ncbi:hypothetical protein [Streptomyces sp. SID3915]|uniref:hypothetical protein n=1 Tax=Streptomyces sp. SID3915 TaxID=2690263 RepID=UPI0013722235|nr:hypothetical protein [Streptomyces sp. SID3915]MYX74160.1 hypothetical protein [Streptomyces sp. SID3915]
MSLRPTLRTAVLAATALGAVLLPSAVAVADSAPSPVPADSVNTPTPVPDSQRAESTEPPAAAEPVPAGAVPRGGVDAGERPAGSTDATALYGSAAGAILLAGAGTLVVRRRSAAQRNG